MELDDNQLEKLMQADINMRESIQELENTISEIKTKRAQVQSALNEACRTLNVSSVKTKVGTLTRKQTNIKQFIVDNPDIAPPGLQSTSEYTVSILKNRKKEENS